QLQAVAGEELKVSPFQISDFPDDRVRLKGIFANDPHVHIAQIVLTPAADRPYEIDYAFDLPRDPSYDAIFARHDVPAFPALADIP
ncbi:MAG TPA: hypothetical protein VFA22_12050, partial [Stellaceae bacterium]|nr:hypothetical protein [Stellaceae bacterium]